MSKSPGGKALLILALTGALGVGALAYYVKFEPGAAKVPPVLREAPSAPPSTVITATRLRGHTHLMDKVQTEVSLPKITGSEAKLEDSSTPVPVGQNPMKFIAEKCLKEANVDDVHVLGVDVVGSIAVINFDDNIDAGMGGNQEGTFLKALQVSFGQFPNIKKVEIQKNNAPVKSLGEIEISGPLDVIRSGNSADSAGSSKPIEP